MTPRTNLFTQIYTNCFKINIYILVMKIDRYTFTLYIYTLIYKKAHLCQKIFAAIAI